MNSPKKITEGAMFLAIFAVLLLITIYIPMMGIIVNLFLALPFMMYAAKNDRQSSFVFLIAAIAISFILGSLIAVPLVMTYGLAGIVIGILIREEKKRATIYIAGSISFLLSLIVQYVMSIVIFEFDFIKDSLKIFEESLPRSAELWTALGQSPNPDLMEQLEMTIKTIEYLVPTMLVMGSFLVVLLVQAVSFPIMNRFKIDTPRFQPFRELRLPKSLLWYYLIVVIISLFFTPAEGSYWYLAIANLLFILQFFMILQGLSLVFFFSHKMNLPRLIPVMIIIFMFLIPILLYIVRILGIIDLGFDLRKQVENKEKLDHK